MNKLAFLLLSSSLWLCACSSTASTIPGTKVPDNAINRGIIQAVEEYRVAFERADAAALLLMAGKSYWEDGGTPTGSDDYGYDGLREVLASRFQKVRDIRYSLRYMNIARSCRADGDPSTNEGCRAYVDVIIDASFSYSDARGLEKRADKRDQNRLELEWSGDRWLFLSGM